MTERRVDVPGGRLAVLDFGEGPPILLLHAGIVDSWAWEPLTPFLLDAGYRVVAFDRRGIGGSATEDVAFSNRADVIAVMDALGIERAALVGHSIGSMIALDTAVESPERVVAMVAIGAGLAGYDVEPTPEEAALFDEMERLEDAGDPDAVADFDVRVWVDGPGQPPDRVPEDIRGLVREMARDIARSQSDPDHHFGRPIPLGPPAAMQLERLTMPVLAIAGELDVSDVAAVARHLEEQVPTARALIMPGVAHMINLEAPEELAARIIDFLATQHPWS
jgi:3-oxoadipate enol-lactonase